MKLLRNYSAITLIALVVTIIILLILVGTTLFFFHTGFIEKAFVATNTYQNQKDNEEKNFNHISTTIDELHPELKIGDYVAYQPETKLLSNQVYEDLTNYSGFSGEDYKEELPIVQENLAWRVFDIKDGQIRLISDAPSTSSIFLEGYQGYNNAVYLINEVCDNLYSSEKGFAKGLSIEDIQQYLSYPYETNEMEENFKYDDKVTLRSFGTSYYPNLYFSELGSSQEGANLNLSEQPSLICQSSPQSASYDVTVTAWKKKNMVPEDFSDFENGNSQYYDMIMNINGPNARLGYCLASRCVFVWKLYDGSHGNKANFSLPAISNNGIHHSLDAVWIYNSLNQSCSPSICFRPIITLNSDITIKLCEGHNSKENAHIIQ